MLLRAATGERPGENVPITAETLEALRPPAGAQEDVVRHFSGHGFGADVPAPVMVTISGTVAQFDAHFGVELVLGDDGAYTVGPPHGASRAELPLTRLPPRIQSLVAEMSLEVPVTPDDSFSP